MNPRLRSLLLSTLGAASLAASLSACVPLMVGGAVGTALVATDRRTSGAQLEDQGIELKGGQRLREILGERGHVNLTSFNRTVLITGEVPTAEDKAAVERAVGQLDNVKGVVNDLGIGPVSSIGARSNDGLITTKVKGRFVESQDLLSNAVKVVTERSVVYLMGRVTEREAKRATDLARGTTGVQKVVTVFDLISEDELARISAPAPSSAATPSKP
ncbi:BON domain-containing protein [Aquariibacter albus]|uniref:BON domain-containing protein n=1 Tax=Aquariibacter albus TaxID=2759899 RepID=A0A839HLW0_9BURK|nr:BON domain-containing protein [Aquariibacter albus]MBB1162966.1 BON domain-containing protein [Aquariibacter albus]